MLHGEAKEDPSRVGVVFRGAFSDEMREEDQASRARRNSLSLPHEVVKLEVRLTRRTQAIPKPLEREPCRLLNSGRDPGLVR
jgi:hypothetical protein